MGSINNMQIKNEEEEEEAACLNAMLFSCSHVFPMVLNAAVELEVFDAMAMAAGHVSASEVVCRLPALTQSPDAAAEKLDRMLRLLASHSLLKCSLRRLEDGGVERVYGLTPACKYFLRRGDGDGGSLSSLLALSNHRAPREVWLHLKDGILDGGSQFNKVFGMSIFQYMDKDQEFNSIFNKAMADLSTIIMKKILGIYKGFEGLTSLVDVAGGTGKCLNMIISKYPSIKGINFDLPHVVQNAPSYPGVEHVGGDMFSNIPKADAIMIKDTFHNWSDEHCMKVLKKCCEVLPSNGKVIVMDVLMPETPETTMASMYVSGLDNTMLMQPGGKERTEKEFQTLCKGSGFSDFRVACCACQLWVVMEFYK